MVEMLNLWENTPGLCEEVPTITYYKPENKKTDAAIVIFPGGGYTHRAVHEGEGYAEFLSANGVSAFVVAYRVSPHTFPLPLLDARRAMRFVRFNSEKYGIDKNKVYAMGSSAGGHLTALLSTYYKDIDFEGVDDIDKENYLPDKQILCYPLISLGDKSFAHISSGLSLLGDKYLDMCDECSPNLIASEKTPDAFIWHTFADNGVNVINSLEYAKTLRKVGKKAEIHIFPDGPHGIGLCNRGEADERIMKHDALWGEMLIKWIEYVD